MRYMTAVSGVLLQGNLDRPLWPPQNASSQYQIATDLCSHCEEISNASHFFPLIVYSSRMDTEWTGHILSNKLHAAPMSLDDVLRCRTVSAVWFGWRLIRGGAPGTGAQSPGEGSTECCVRMENRKSHRSVVEMFDKMHFGCARKLISKKHSATVYQTPCHLTSGWEDSHVLFAMP